MSGDFGLDNRRREILSLVLRQYIATGLPVGSKAVAEQLHQLVSSATVRNVMADLEEEGYLAQPHPSAGRVPTDLAYRFYVDQVISSTRLAPDTEKYIDEALSVLPGAPEQFLANTSHLLAEISQNVGLVLGPPLEEKLLEHIQFVKLPNQRVLVIIVSKPDLAEDRVLRLDEEFSQEELDRTAEYLNADFRGWSLRTIRLELVKRMEEDKRTYDRLLKNVATLFMWGALADEDPGTLFLDGTSRILAQPEFEDVRKVKELLAAFEEKAKLIKILSACLDVPNMGVQILIGRENPELRMRQCTFVLAPFHYRNHALGVLGVVGPTRMEYEKAIMTVGYIAHRATRILSVD